MNPHFYLFLEVHTEQRDRENPALTFCAVSFREILDGTTKLPIIISADSPEEALALGRMMFPTLSNFLAVQDTTSYVHHINARNAAKARRALQRSAEAAGA